MLFLLQCFCNIRNLLSNSNRNDRFSLLGISGMLYSSIKSFNLSERMAAFRNLSGWADFRGIHLNEYDAPISIGFVSEEHHSIVVFIVSS